VDAGFGRGRSRFGVCGVSLREMNLVQLVRALLAFFVLGLSQALWLMAVAVVMFLVMVLGEAWIGIQILWRWMVDKIRSFVDRYLVHLLAIGTLAFIGFQVAQATCNAEQNERLRSVENDATVLHLEERLDVLLTRTAPTAR
jgi:hypothetical protein